MSRRWIQNVIGQAERGAGNGMTGLMYERQNLERAFWRVESAQGIAGVDGVSLGAFRRELDRNLDELGRELEQSTYHPLPLLKYLVARADGSPRSLFMPTVRDRTCQAALVNVIEPLLDSSLEDWGRAYHTTRCVRYAATRARELWQNGYRYAVNGNLDAFFENLPHPLILRRLGSLLDEAAVVELAEMWVAAEVYDGESVRRLEKGVPVGSVIAPTLANLLLDVLDGALVEMGRQMVRYGDDLVILAREPVNTQQAVEVTERVLAGLEHRLDPEGSEVTDFWQGMEYYGLVFPGDVLLAPFDRSPKPRNILYLPPPFDLSKYLGRGYPRHSG